MPRTSLEHLAADDDSECSLAVLIVCSGDSRIGVLHFVTRIRVIGSVGKHKNFLPMDDGLHRALCNAP